MVAVLVAADGERSFVTDRGAADALAAKDLRASWFRGAAWLHVPAYALLADPLRGAAMRAVELARQRGAGVSVDLASARPLEALGPGEAEVRVSEVAPDVLFATPDEARVLAGTRGARALLAVSPILVLKEGRAGCRVLAASSPTAERPVSLTVATTPLPTTDSTGAGDAFDAGFILGWLAAGGPTLSVEHASGALRRAAVAGNRAAARHLSGPRPSLQL